MRRVEGGACRRHESFIWGDVDEGDGLEMMD